MRTPAMAVRGLQRSPVLNRALVVLSLCALVIGLAFPVGARAVNPFLAYGIVFVSWPAWTVGAIAGAVAGHRIARQPGGSRLARWGVVLCAANVVAAVATLLIPFHAS